MRRLSENREDLNDRSALRRSSIALRDCFLAFVGSESRGWPTWCKAVPYDRVDCFKVHHPTEDRARARASPFQPNGEYSPIPQSTCVPHSCSTISLASAGIFKGLQQSVIPSSPEMALNTREVWSSYRSNCFSHMRGRARSKSFRYIDVHQSSPTASYAVRISGQIRVSQLLE